MTRPRVATPAGPRPITPSPVGAAITHAPRDFHHPADATSSPGPSALHEPSPPPASGTSLGLSSPLTPSPSTTQDLRDPRNAHDPHDPGHNDAPPPPTSHNSPELVHSNVVLPPRDSDDYDSEQLPELAPRNVIPRPHDAPDLAPSNVTLPPHRSPESAPSNITLPPCRSHESVPSNVALRSHDSQHAPELQSPNHTEASYSYAPEDFVPSGLALRPHDSHYLHNSRDPHDFRGLPSSFDPEPRSALRAPHDPGHCDVPPSHNPLDLRSPRIPSEPQLHRSQHTQVATRPPRSPQLRGTIPHGGAPSRSYSGGSSSTRPRPANPARRPYGASTSLTYGGAPARANSLGPLTGLGVALMLGAGCAFGALLDMLLVGGPAWALAVIYVAACGYTATRVRRADWFSALVSPPLAFAAAVIMLAMLMPSSFGPGALGTIATTFTLLAAKAKALYVGNAISAGVLFSRRIKARRAIPSPRAAS